MAETMVAEDVEERPPRRPVELLQGTQHRGQVAGGALRRGLPLDDVPEMRHEAQVPHPLPVQQRHRTLGAPQRLPEALPPLVRHLSVLDVCQQPKPKQWLFS
ncbi:MAG: hypothetical protein Q8P67_06990 [archaeon]|nr:hypothetical protein [archaeon]